MASTGKIDVRELERLLSEGKRTKDIAQHFGVTTGAVSQAKRRLGVAVAAVAATQMTAPPVRVTPVAVQAAGGIVEKRNQAMEILAELASKVNRELSWIEDTIPPGMDGEYRQWVEQKLKHVAEIRKVVTAMADVGSKLYQVSVVEQALRVMLEEIGHESPECKRRIRDRLARCSINLPMAG